MTLASSRWPLTSTAGLAMALALQFGPAAAWEFTPRPICTLAHPTELGEVTVTYDPGSRLYAIDLFLAGAIWPDAEVFAIEFIGPRSLQIATDRHQLSESSHRLTVTDRGFGNVLDGLQYNSTALAKLGDQKMEISLLDAAEPIEAFRSCAVAALS